MSKKTFVAGEKLLASELNNNFNLSAQNPVITIKEAVSIRDALVAGFILTDVISQTAIDGGYNRVGHSSSMGLKAGQTFSLDAEIKLGKISAWTTIIGTPSSSLICKIFLSDKTTQVGSSVTVLSGDVVNNGFTEFNFISQDITLSDSTTYFIEISCSSDNISHYYGVYQSGSDTYADGSVWAYGTSWVENSAKDMTFKISYKTEGYVKGDASDSDLLNVQGFAQESGVLDDEIIMITSGTIGGFTGLTFGATYYLSDTAGEISDSAGTNSVKVGTAISDTELLIITPPL